MSFADHRPRTLSRRRLGGGGSEARSTDVTSDPPMELVIRRSNEEPLRARDSPFACQARQRLRQLGQAEAGLKILV